MGDHEPLTIVLWVLTGLNYAIIAFLVPRILFQRRDPRATLAWLFFVLLVPFLGLLGFWVLGSTQLKMRRWRRRHRRAGVPDMPSGRPEWGPREGAAPPIDPSLAELVRRLEPPPSDHNAVELLVEGAATFDAFEAAIDAATDHVHCCFYIWLPDATGRRIRDALERAARRDVTVRVLVDDVGARAVDRRFFAPLVEAGGHVRRFLPVSLMARRISINHRNHRKVLVVDGRAGFTGGANVGDDYAGQGDQWLDAQVRLEGPVVLRLQEVFCLDWYRTTGEDLSSDATFPQPLPHPTGVWAQILESGPDKPLHAIHTLIAAAISRATRRVLLVTPYFVPDAAMLLAMKTAALQGADVRVLLPTPDRNDHPLISHAGRSYYEELLRCGVRVFEVPARFVHAKVIAVDGGFASVGSANLDERSQRLNFEVNAFVYGPSLAAEVEAFCASLQEQSQEVRLDEHQRRPRHIRLKEALARLLTPIL